MSTAVLVSDLHAKLRAIEFQIAQLMPLADQVLSQFAGAGPILASTFSIHQPPPQHVSNISLNPYKAGQSTYGRTHGKRVSDAVSTCESAILENWASEEVWESQITKTPPPVASTFALNTGAPIGTLYPSMSSNDIFSMVENEQAGNSVWRRFARSTHGSKQSTLRRGRARGGEEASAPTSSKSHQSMLRTPPSQRKRVESSQRVNKQHGGSLFISSPVDVAHQQRPTTTAESNISATLNRELAPSISAEPKLEYDTVSNEAICGSIATMDEEDSPDTAFEIIPKEPSPPTQLDRKGFSLSKRILTIETKLAKDQTDHSRAGYRSADISWASVRSVESAKPDATTIKEEDQTLTSAVEKPKKNFLSHFVKTTTINRYKPSGSLATIFEDSSLVILREAKESPRKRVREARGISRYSIASATWELIMAATYIGIIWIIPFKIAFARDIDWIYSILLSVIFSVDTAMSFYTMRYHKGILTINKKPSLRDWQQHYLRTSFLVDILTAFPYELMPFRDSYYFWIIRCIRVHKLPNILSDSPYCVILRKRLEKALGIGQTFSGIFPLTFGLCAFLHVQACVLFFVGRLCQFSNSIIAQIEFKNSFEQYTWGLFTAIGNTFPLFYKPNTPQEQMVMLCFSILGAALYASIVGTISSFSMGIDASGRLYKQKLDELREYMGWKDLDEITQRKVLRYYELKYRGKFFEEATLLNEMNESLRMEIAVHNCKQLISKVPFLNREMGDGRDHVFLGRLATSLTAAYFIPGDSIVTAGDIGTEMFFILKGTVRILVNGNVVGQMSDGAFFGELALIANIPRTATVQAMSSCTLYRLTRMDLMRILPEFEDMQQRIYVIYQQRMEKVRLEQLQR
ncbi:hypothetical protein BJ741DRAFT_712574 [Chytriomyces cf. hyalinus JEL632]|nr:hypothetical protein BJ741DRAFT_712574 [Chytriomyces cf. hyalinus JEL632]